MDNDDREDFGALGGWPTVSWSVGSDVAPGRVSFRLGMGMFFYTRHSVRISVTGGESGAVFVRVGGRSRTNPMDAFRRIRIRSGKTLVFFLLCWTSHVAESASITHFRTG